MEHKEITLRYSRALEVGELDAIGRFNAAFAPSDLQLRADGANVQIILRQVDMEKLRQATGEMAADSAVFADVLRSVEGIGSYALAGGKRQFVGYNAERKVQARKQKEQTRMPFFYARDHGFSQINHEMPAAFCNAIVCGDSEEVLRQLPDNCIDIVFTSPPYNFGLDYADSGDADAWQAYFDKLYAVFRQCIRVLKFGGRLVVNVQPLLSDYIPSHHILSSFFMQEKLIWKGEILWEKNNYNCKYTAWGSWKSPSNPYLKTTWEYIEVFCKGDLKKPGDRDRIDISADDFKQWTTAKWSLAPERRMKEFGHPAMFPEALAARVLQLFSYQGDIALDPFNGVGTTTAVAHRLGRRYLGIDISQDYCDTARARLQAVGKEKGLFVNGK